MKLIQIRERKNMCKHKNIELDLDMRSIQCTSCQANVDSFDWIHKVSIEEDILMSRIRTLNAQIAELQKKKAQIK